uniref:ATP-binding cassette sub-family D member 3 n=1 Tax=Timema cristinae TaxID=61476 RepID=A0A7R9DCE2_TIMCR|nr:unnamed protein product [Timema cristinae]
MAPALSKYITTQSVLGAASVSVFLLLLRMRRKSERLKKLRKAAHADIQYVVGEKSTTKTKAQVDALFLRQLRKLLGIVVPGVFTPETGHLVLIAAALVARSLCDLWMIQTGTHIETAIVNMNAKVFRRKILLFALAMPFIALVNNVLKYGIWELKLRFRTRLTHYLYDHYLKGFTYYKMSNLDNRIANADQLLTTDVDKFCETVTDLYSNISKPMLDMSIYVYRLTTKLGWATPSLVFLYLLFAGFLLTYLRRPTGRMTVVEQKLEGEFRYINSRLITNSEEVAFYQGNHREKLTLLASFEKLCVSHHSCVCSLRPDLATVVGYYAVSVPFFNQNHSLLSGLAQEERFRMTRLAGFTTRVTELIKVLDDLNQGHYERTMITNGTVSSIITDKSGLLVSTYRFYSRQASLDNIIRFDRVPLVTPNGDILIEELTFEVQSGINVLVCGPNGCGKSSLFRILGELWPLFGGTLTKPPRGKLFYIPQRPYMTLGTLRDQVIYPHTREEMTRRGRTDAELTQHLDRVKLSYLLSARENGWDAVEDWIDVLSGGEKQRIAVSRTPNHLYTNEQLKVEGLRLRLDGAAPQFLCNIQLEPPSDLSRPCVFQMARLFYHKPQFAILDECTSAVSVDVEGSMYQYCRESGITLFTVSHRRSLWKHHEYYLRMDGRGAFEFKPIDTDTEEFGS